VAFLTLRFKVVIDVIRIDPPSAIEARITGDAIGLAGHVVATASLDLTDAGEHRTTIRYATDVGLTGKLGGLGRPVFRDDAHREGVRRQPQKRNRTRRRHDRHEELRSGGAGDADEAVALLDPEDAGVRVLASEPR
jgi:hypothetical protein